MESGYINSNMTKHIIPKLFYPHELQKNGEIEILQAKSCDNLADLFTKSLSYSTFHKCVEGIGMRRLRDLQESGGRNSQNITCINSTLHSFLKMSFTLLEFYHIKFLMR